MIPAMELGRQLKAQELCRITVGSTLVWKRRTEAADFLIPPGNLLLRWHPVPVHMAPVDDWARWEDRLYRRLYGQTVRQEGETLILPRLPGTPVLDQLDDPRAFPAAVAALLDLHRHSFLGRRISHGDATAHNVLFDGSEARWFDFDAMHDLRTPASLRHADDLRALLFSAVGRAPERIEALLDAVMAYPDAVVLQELGRLVVSWRLHWSPYHHGQALMTPDIHDGLIARIRYRITSRTDGPPRTSNCISPS